MLTRVVSDLCLEKDVLQAVSGLMEKVAVEPPVAEVRDGRGGGRGGRQLMECEEIMAVM